MDNTKNSTPQYSNKIKIKNYLIVLAHGTTGGWVLAL